MKRIILILSILAAGACQSFAQPADNLVFGPEWTFTKPEYLEHRPTLSWRQTLETLQQAIARVSPATQWSLDKSTWTESGVVSYGPDFKLVIGMDQGVIEVQSTPQSLRQWKSRAASIQKDLFDTARDSLGVAPHPVEGAGHLNIGLSPVFSENPLLFRNFVVDFLNNPGIGVILGHQPTDQKFAIHLSERPEYQKQMFQRDLEKMDQQLQLKPTSTDFAKLFKFFTLGSFNGNHKFIALGVRGSVMETYSNEMIISPDARLEIRTLRPQASMDEFIRIVEIYEARIRYLKTRKDFLPFQNPPPIRDGYEAIRQFYFYLTEAGLDYDRYKTLMPPSWRDIPLKDFLSSEELKKTRTKRNRKTAPSCPRVHF